MICVPGLHVTAYCASWLLVSDSRGACGAPVNFLPGQDRVRTAASEGTGTSEYSPFLRFCTVTGSCNTLMFPPCAQAGTLQPEIGGECAKPRSTFAARASPFPCMRGQEARCSSCNVSEHMTRCCIQESLEASYSMHPEEAAHATVCQMGQHLKPHGWLWQMQPRSLQVLWKGHEIVWEISRLHG